jgi:DNA polymerase III epsilon subunit-like protein
VQLARRLLPNLPSYSLHALVRHFRLTHTAEHRAGLDAQATLQVLLQLSKLGAAQARGRYVDSSLLRDLIASEQLASKAQFEPALARIA